MATGAKNGDGSGFFSAVNTVFKYSVMKYLLSKALSLFACIKANTLIFLRLYYYHCI